MNSEVLLLLVFSPRKKCCCALRIQYCHVAISSKTFFIKHRCLTCWCFCWSTLHVPLTYISGQNHNWIFKHFVASFYCCATTYFYRKFLTLTFVREMTFIKGEILQYPEVTSLNLSLFRFFVSWIHPTFSLKTKC